jgi:NitT/TauT family transport system ATP-binding protein
LGARLISLILLIAAWYAGSRLAGARLLPDPEAVALAIVDEARSGALAFNLGATLARVAVAFTLAMALGSVIGLVMGRSRLADRLGDPWLIVLLNLPALVIIVLAYVWAGLTETAAIAAVALNKLPIATVTVREGARSLDRASTTWRRCSAWGHGPACGTSYCRSSPLISPPPPAPACPWSGRSCSLWNCSGARTASASRSASRSNYSTSPVSWPMLSPSSPSCWRSKRFWCSRLNDMSPAGVRDRLNVSIKQKSYRAASGEQLLVLGELAFSLANGEVAALVGPSGCGKTTLLRIIAGLDRDFEGNVELPAHGTLGMVFQEPRLLPWRTVEQNVRLAAPQATDAALDTLFQALGLTAHREHYPGELSLGLARRVALARAFAVEPDLLLLDEPFVSLDDALAARLRDELADLVNRRPVTTLLVTHNVEEAIGLADRLLLLSLGPARVLGDVPVTRPRTPRTPQELAAMREEIAERINQAYL